MQASFPIAHARMLKYEGGYSNHPQDPGGVTLEGITQSVYDDYRLRKGLPRRALRKEVRGTPEWTAERDEIYRSGYWIPPKCHALPAGVDAAIYDYSVNSGVGRSRKVLQRLVGVPATGIIDAATLDAVKKRDPKQLVAAICEERLRFLKSLKTWPTFGRGWGARVADVKAYATALAVGAINAPPAAPAPAGEGKGEVPAPKKTKAVVKGSAPGAAIEEAVRDGGGWLDWIAAHPFEAVVLASAAGVVVWLILRAIARWHRNKQEAPVPGIGVVPPMLEAV